MGKELKMRIYSVWTMEAKKEKLLRIRNSLFKLCEKVRQTPSQAVKHLLSQQTPTQLTNTCSALLV